MLNFQVIHFTLLYCIVVNTHKQIVGSLAIRYDQNVQAQTVKLFRKLNFSIYNIVC